MTGAMGLSEIDTIRFTPRKGVERAISPKPQPVKRNDVASARGGMLDVIR